MNNTPCVTCGHRPGRAYRHRMDSSKVNLLEKIGRLNRGGVVWVKVQRDGNLIPEAERAATIQCDDVHALRLFWFGLLEKRGPRRGEYRITQKGAGFLAAAATVPSWIECRRGKVVAASPLEVSIEISESVVLNKAYWDLYAKGLAA